jgi:hypothetical protein
MSSLLREFVPLVYSSVSFEFGSRKESINTIIDPRKDQYGNRAAAGLLNQHIMKPAPFINAKVDVSLGLCRTRVADHTGTVIKLLIRTPSGLSMSDSCTRPPAPPRPREHC